MKAGTSSFPDDLIIENGAQNNPLPEVRGPHYLFTKSKDEVNLLITVN
jgi:hypothetical protein